MIYRTKLKNIEETERAKRKHLEKNTSSSAGLDDIIGSKYVATQRCTFVV